MNPHQSVPGGSRAALPAPAAGEVSHRNPVRKNDACPLPRLASVAMGGGLAAAGVELLVAVEAEPEVLAFPAEFLPAAAATAVLVSLVLAALGALARGLPRAWKTRLPWRRTGFLIRSAPAAGAALGLALAWSGLWFASRHDGSLEHEHTWLDLLVLAAGAGFSALAAARLRPRPRLALVGAALAALLAAGGAHLRDKSRFQRAAETVPGARQPAGRRILLLTADALRADALRMYRADAPPTPHLEELASRSVVFRNAYSASSWTLPSIGSLMTGLPPLTHQLTGTGVQLPSEFPTLAQRLREAGFATAAVVENTILDPSTNLLRGFDEYAAFPRRDRLLHEPLGRRVLRRLFPSRFPLGGSREVTATAREWLLRNWNRDFFLWVHYYDPHVPYEPPAEFLPPHRPPASIGTAFYDSTHIRLGRMLTPRERSWIRMLYEAEVRFVDSEVGKLLNTLRELGLYDETLILFTSDHGEEFWEHGGYEHGHALYEEVVHVPLMVKLPGATEGAVIDARVANWHLMPTVLDRVGARPAGPCAGSPSLAVYFDPRGPNRRDQEILLSSLLYFQDQVGFISGHRKFIRKLMDEKEETYDLRRDPREQDPRAGETSLLKARLDVVSAYYQGIRDCYAPKVKPIPTRGQYALERLKALGYIQ